MFEVFAFYKNFGLLACFLGLGLGYALSGRQQIPLLLAVPLLAWQMVLFAVSRYGPPGWNSGVFMVAPVLEVHHMGLAQFQVDAKSVAYYGSVLYLLATVFVLTALAFVPIGQLCGSLMNRLPKLRAYGLNLLGSLLGVGIMFALSMFWTPPLIWFTLLLHLDHFSGVQPAAVTHGRARKLGGTRRPCLARNPALGADPFSVPTYRTRPR